MEFKKKGNVQVAVAALMITFIGLVVITMFLIMGNVLSAKVYSQFEDDITAISNTNIKNAVNEGVIFGFQGTRDTAELLPTFGAITIIIVLFGMFMGFILPMMGSFGIGGGGGYSGGAL
jgi:hypothetical protein